MRSTARVLTLVEILETGGIRTVAELADRLNVDKRTVRRYVDHLRELDVPVDSVRGRYGGYRLAPNYRMPPLMLTDEEALAVTWALLVAGSTGSGPVSASVVENAAEKVRRTMPASLRRRIETVLDTVDFADASDRVKPIDLAGDDPAQVLFVLAEAARDRRPVAFEYTPVHGRQSHRTVDPHGLVAHRGSVYLAAHDSDRNSARTFRLDRITRVRLLDGTFSGSSAVDPRQQVLGPLPPRSDRVEVCVLVAADRETVWAHVPRILASVTPVPEHRPGQDWVRIILRVERLDWVARKLAALDRPFVVEHPPELVTAVQALGRRLLDAATSGPNIVADALPPMADVAGTHL